MNCHQRIDEVFKSENYRTLWGSARRQKRASQKRVSESQRELVRVRESY